MSVVTVRAAIATRLATISGLRATADYPESITPPMAVVQFPDIDFGQAFGGDYAMTIPVVVLVAKGPGDVRAQQALDAYLDPSGSSSVMAALEAAGRLGGTVQNVKVTGVRNYGGGYQFHNVEYFGATFNVEVVV